jgi:membrane-bound ClpP family serine protease
MNADKGCFIGCMGMIAAMAVLLVGAVALVWLCMSAVGMTNDGDGGEWPERDKPREKVWVCGEGDEDSPQVLRVKISGVISESQGDIFGREKSSATAALAKIRSAVYDDDIQGLYLVLDTPGGEVTLSDVIADAVRRFRKSREDRFALVEMGAICCSGGYYIASAADYIIAHPTTVTGSIGVLMSTINAAELAKKAQPAEMWLTHYSPSLMYPEDYMNDVRRIFPQAKAAKDGWSVDLMFDETDGK